MLRAAAAAAAVPVEAVVIMGTHGGLRAKPAPRHKAKHGVFDFLFPVTWPRADVEICGMGMPAGGNVNFAGDDRETQALHAATYYLQRSGTFFDNHNRKLRRLADALLKSDQYLPHACHVGSNITDTNLLDELTPETHKGSTLEADLDSAVSGIMEDRTAFDAVKGCVSNGTLDNRQIIANYVPVVYSNTGRIEHSAGGPTKVPLCSKMFTLSQDEYSKGTGSFPHEHPEAEWRVTLLIKYSDGTVTENPQFVQQLMSLPPSPDIFPDDDDGGPVLRADEHNKVFYTETLIAYLISQGYTKITIVDVTCNVFRNSGPRRPGGYPFESVCEDGMTHETQTLLHRTVTPWILLSQYGILENYDNPHHARPESDDGYYRDRFRNATNETVYQFIENYYGYLQIAFECKESAKRKFKKLLKTIDDSEKKRCIQYFFDCYKQRTSDTDGVPIRPTAHGLSLARTAPSQTSFRRGGKKTKTRRVKRHKSRNFRNKSRFRRTRRRVIKRKNN
jgi:hypothetical protein